MLSEDLPRPEAKTASITIDAGGRKQHYQLRRGLGLQALAAQQGIPIEFDCREADCGICIVRVKEGLEHLTPKTHEEADFLRAMRADPDERLACQCRILGDVTIEVET